VQPAAIVKQVVLPGLLPLLPMVAVLLAIRSALAPSTIVTIALAGIAGAIVYLAVYLAVPETASERLVARRLLTLSGRLLGRRSAP
jgi:zinc transporter ZupT